LRVSGLLEDPLSLTWEEFRSLPTLSLQADFHCVTHWSRLDNLWEGVSFRELATRVRPHAEARYVMVHCYDGFTTNLPLAVLLDQDVLLAYRHDGAELAPEHGWPLRLVVPKRYAWKSAKWVERLEFLAQDQPGFWEQRGYHNDADPWAEERYAEGR
jgi:DMSO/TMAO reductase YedYZ molybdopterin-dependent catalytic subunit